MQGMLENIIIDKRKLTIYRPATSLHCPAVYCLAGADLEGFISEMADFLEPLFFKKCPPFFIILVPPVSWDLDYTPWPAPPAAGRSEPFGGGADAFLDWLTDSVKPYLEHALPIDSRPEQTGLVGYSLGGLAALYEGYRCDAFGRIGSVSGSLWYSDWLTYMKTHHPINNALRVYLSLGAKEERTSDPILSTAGEAIKEAKRLLDSQLVSPCRLEWNSGGHFSKIPQRIAKALAWIMEEKA